MRIENALADLPGAFVIKDSGERMQFTSGMQRDTAEGKRNYALVYDGPMFERWAEHLTKGAVKYSKRNWMKANGTEEYERFRESAWHHFVQWFRGDQDEDHAAAVFFNINGVEYMNRRADEHGTGTDTAAEADRNSPKGESRRPTGSQKVS